MAYDLSSIRLNVSLGNTKKTIDELNALVKQLETKRVKLEVDVTSIKAGVDVATREIEKAYQEQVDAKKKAENENLKTVRQSHEQAMAYLRKQQQEIKNTYGVDSKLTFNKNPNTGDITSAMISFQKEAGKAETKMYSLNESVRTFEESGSKIKTIKLAPINDKTTDDIVKVSNNIAKAQANLDKFKNSMNTKIEGVKVGRNGDWATNLKQFDELQIKMNELNSIQANDQNLDLIASKIKEINDLYSKTSTEITRVTQLNQELTTKNGFNNNTTQSIEKYNGQLDLLISKNEKLANNPAMQKVREDVQRLNSTPPTEFSNACKQVENNISKIEMQMESTTKKGTSFFGDLGSSVKKAFGYLGGATVIYKFADAVRQIPAEIQKVDSSLVELNKVANLSQQELDSFMNTAYKLGDNLAKTGSQVADATTEFIKAGYELSESTNLAEDTLLSMNVGTGLNSLDDAAGAMVATLKGFQMEASSSNMVVSAMAKVADETAIGYGELADGITRVSATMNQGNTSFSETLGLLTSTFELSQNIEKSATGINSISQRMRGLKLSEDGSLEKDVVLLGKVEGALKDIAGVNLMDQKGQLRSTFDVLQDLSKVWKDLSINDQQYLGEKLSGNRNNVILSQILSNWQAVDKAMQAVSESAGYAEEVNSRFLDSVNGRLAALQSSWQQLALNTMSSDILKETISLTNEFIKLLDACGGLDTVLMGVASSFIALKVATMFLNKGELSDGIGLLISKMLTYKATIDTTTGSVIALSLATKVLIGGAIIVGVMAIGGAIKYIGESSERAREKISELNNEINKAVSTKTQTDELVKQYAALDKLSKSQKLNNEQQMEFTRIQNELKSLIPEINGYRNESGDFIITETDLVKKLNEVYDELITKKRQEKAETAKGLLSDNNKQYEDDIKTLNNLQKNLDTFNKAKNGGKLTSDENMLISTVTKYSDLDSLIKDTENSMNNLRTSTNSAMSDMRQGVLDMVYGTDKWASSTDEQTSAMKEFITTVNADELDKYVDALADGSMSSEEFVAHMLEIPKVQQLVTDAMNGVTASGEGVSETLYDMADVSKEVMDNIGLLNSSINSLSEGQTLTEKTLLSLVSAYPELRDSIVERNGVMTIEIGILEDLRDMTIEEQRVALEANYNKTVDLKTQTEARLNYYKSELEALKTLASAQAAYALSYQTNVYARFKDPSKDFPNLINNENAVGDTQKRISEVNSWIAKEEQLAKSQAVAANNAKNLIQDFEIATSLGNTKKGSNISNKKGTKDKKDKVEYEKYFSQLIDEKINIILSENKRLEDAISLTQEKLAHAELVGNREQQEALKNDLIEYAKKRRDLTASTAEELRKIGNDARTQLSSMKIKGYENFNFSNLNEKEIAQINQAFDKSMTGVNEKTKASIELQKSKFGELSAVITRIYGNELPQLSKDWHTENISSLQHQIDLIQKKSELEKQAYDDKLKQIELQQFMLGEDSKEYKALEEEKINSLLALQQGYQDSIKQLKAKGLSDEHEYVREYINLYTDAEMEILNIRKASAEKERQSQIEASKLKVEQLEKQKKAIEDTTKLAMDMIKKEQELKKKAIQDEIDGYGKIINAKKEALTDEHDEKDYKKELSKIEQQEKVLNDKLFELSMDNSGSINEEKLALEKELRDLLEKKEELQNDKTLENQQELLDKGLEAYEKEKQEELDKLDDYLSKEGEIRQDALNMIERNNKELYDKLLKYNATYGDMIESDIQDAWNLATDAMDEFSNGQFDLLDTLRDITNEMSEQVKLQKELENKHWTEMGGVRDDDNASNPGGQNNKQQIISKMIQNSINWRETDDVKEREALAKENQKLGTSVGAYYKDGKWYHDKELKIPLFHKGLEYGQLGSGIKPSEMIIKATKDEWVFTDKQMTNLDSNLSKLMLNKSAPSLSIAKLFDVTVQGGVTKDIDMKKIIREASDYTLNKLKDTLRDLGY